MCDVVNINDTKQVKLNTKQTMKQKLHSSTIFKNRDNVLSGKQFLLIIPLTKFFCEEVHINKLKSIIDGTSKLSLRLIDWFVTNYSKKNLVMYNLTKLKRKIDETDSGVESIDDDKVDEEYFSDYFNVFNDYRGQLKALNKKNFDPFCRRSRIKFFYNEKDYIITTVGQLNFFKWAIENCILDYIESNMKEIEDDMNNFTNIKKYAGEKTKKNTTGSGGATKPEKGEKKAKRKYVKKKKTSGKHTKKNTDNDVEQQTKVGDNNEKTTKNTRRKRKELSVSANKSFIVHNLKSVIKFD